MHFTLHFFFLTTHHDTALNNHTSPSTDHTNIFCVWFFFWRNADTKNKKLLQQHSPEKGKDKQGRHHGEWISFRGKGSGCTTNTLLGVCTLGPKMSKKQRPCRVRDSWDVRVPEVWWRVVHQRHNQLLLGPASGDVDESTQRRFSPILRNRQQPADPQRAGTHRGCCVSARTGFTKHGAVHAGILAAPSLSTRATGTDCRSKELAHHCILQVPVHRPSSAQSVRLHHRPKGNSHLA